MHKRGIGRLVIGDEFDTSRHVTTRVIRHYDGLYDQSIWFDGALSRYFMRKGWTVSQFSVLRPLSELLIEKILARRYPHLQAHQTSCHAAHKSADRVKPCGKCEKCRRIVGMLTALEEDPTRCGYSENQISTCLAALFDQGLYSQLSAEAGQLFYMLAQHDRVPIPDTVARSVRPYPEIMKLRFDPAISPIHGIPEDLRVGLYRIFMEYAAGAVEPKGSGVAADRPLFPPGPEQALFFRHGTRCGRRSGRGRCAAGHLFLGRTLLAGCHGASRYRGHSPAAGGRHRTARPPPARRQRMPMTPSTWPGRSPTECSNPKPLVLPLIAYGVSYHHEAFKGTISINNDTLANLGLRRGHQRGQKRHQEAGESSTVTAAMLPR